MVQLAHALIRWKEKSLGVNKRLSVYALRACTFPKSILFKFSLLLPAMPLASFEAWNNSASFLISIIDSGELMSFRGSQFPYWYSLSAW